jgi:FkbM family methyltransferase
MWIRHGSGDAGTWAEVNIDDVYHAPWELPSGLRVLDLGGHVGYFARFALERWSVGSLVSVEPDPGNWEVLQRNREAVADLHWQLVHAAATTHDGTVRFAGGRGPGSHIEDGSADLVPSIDALRLLGECDLAKIDIEGAEWAVLADPRFVARAPPLLVLEYHPAPGVVDAAAEARALLQAAGYELVEGAIQAFGIGMLWARRQDRPNSAQEEQPSRRSPA